MRKVTMMVALVALMVALFATAAYAVNKQCTNLRCEGTDNRDTLIERGGDGVSDNIYGLQRNDRLDATRFTDDADNLYGNTGNDTLDATDGDGLDTLNGGKGTDTCYGDTGDEFVSCEVINP
jgi:Ca2+-binding RTX toxin-like protein